MNRFRAHLSSHWCSAAVAALCLLALASCAQNPQSITDLTEPITTPGWIRFRSSVRVDPATFFDRYSPLLNLTADTKMRLVSTLPDDIGQVHYRFQQYFREFEVEGAEFVIHAKDGRAISANGPIDSAFQPPSTEARITEAQAVAVVQTRLRSNEFLPPDKLVAEIEARAAGTRTPYQLRGALVFTKLPADPSSRVLAWRMDAYIQPLPDSKRIYVDANQGTIIKEETLMPNCFASSGPTSFRGNQNFNTGKKNVASLGERFVLLDDCHMNQLHELSFNNTSGTSKEIFDSDNSWFDVDRGLVTSFWALGIAYDYFDLVLGRKSYDGKNANMVIVNDPNLGNNARGGGGTITIGIAGPGSTDDYNPTDIVGHEFMHSLIEQTAKLGYDATQEAAALNESFSDIFGEMVETWEESTTNPDWIIGADKGCAAGQICRNLKNPKAFSHPDTYQGTSWQFTDIDPHINGNVQNRWYSLLVEGGTGNTEAGTQYNVTGIGLQKATRIAYRTLTRYLTAGSGFTDAREGSIEAARDLFGASSKEEGDVIKSWCAVGLCPYTVPTQADKYDRPNGNPNPASPNNNNTLAGATPIGSAGITVIGAKTDGWSFGARPNLSIRDLSIFPTGDVDNFRIKFPEVQALSGRCFSSGYSFVFSADVDARVFLNGTQVRFVKQTRTMQVGLPNNGDDFVLQVSAPFAGQILSYNVSAGYYMHYRSDCFQNNPQSKLDEIRSCPMCDLQILGGIDRVILEASYRKRDNVIAADHYFYHAGGGLSVPITVREGNGLKVSLVNSAGREIQAASRSGDSNKVTVGGNAPAGVYSLRFSGYGNGTQLDVVTPVTR